MNRQYLTVQSGFRDVPHGMLDGPDDTIHEQLELGWRNGEKSYNTVYVNKKISQKYKVVHTRETVQVDCPQ